MTGGVHSFISVPCYILEVPFILIVSTKAEQNIDFY